MATQVSLNDGAVASAGALAIQTNGTTQAVSISTGQVATLAQNPILTSGTANGVAYLNGSKVLTTGSALVFDGTTLTGTQSTAAQISLNNSSGNYLFLTAAGGNSYIDNRITGGATNFRNGGAYTWSTYGGSDRMTLDTSSRLMVGTTTAGGVIHASSGNGGAFLQITNSTSGKILQLENNSAGINFYTDAAVPISFYNSGTERARIDSSGNLLVGMTSTSGQSGLSIVPASATYTAIHHANGTASGAEYALFRYNGSGIGSITQNGTTGVLYNLTSDYRLKNDQQALTGAKDFIMALKPKKWQWWDGSGEGVGFIAHEFMEVAKYSGNGEKDAVDSDGKPVYQSIQPSSSEVMANLVAFVQELKAEIDSLKSQFNGA